MSTIAQYFEYVKHYEEKYGKCALVLMQIGSFYELYEYDGVGKCTELCNRVQLKRTKKSSKKPLSETNPYMVGVPIAVFEKWRDVFIDLGYTIIKIDQSPTNKTKRQVTELISKGTVVDDDSIVNSVMCVYCEDEKAYGIATVDLVTATSSFVEVYSLEDVQKFIDTVRPKEIVTLSKIDGVDATIIHHTPDEVKQFTKIQYQEELLRKVFSLESNLEPFEELEFGQLRYASTAFVILLQFLHEHHESHITRLQRPTLHTNSNALHIPHNTIYHLNLISNNQLQLNASNKKITSLFSVIDKTQTAMGKRFLKERLLQPYTCITTIERMYDNIQSLLESNCDFIRKELQNVPDLSRYHRKISLRTIAPQELIRVYEYGYLPIVRILNGLKKSLKNITSVLHKPSFKRVLQVLKKTLETNQENTFIRKGVDVRLDEIHRQMRETRAILENHAFDTLELIDGEMYGHVTTKTRAKLLKGYESRDVKGGKVHVFTVELYKAGQTLYSLECESTTLQRKLFDDLINTIDVDYSNTLHQLIELTTQLDYLQNGAYIAKKYNYHRPIIESKKNTSFFEAKELRHPIIERIIDEEYITNDVSLGKDSAKGKEPLKGDNPLGDKPKGDNPLGLLLYGPNSIGKTSLAKAVGCSIILAQMGYYTPSHLTYSPYTNILTRLSGNDNLFRHQSSFVLEMVELRSILKNASSTSLILGDELCRGTESVSGTALTLSTINSLLKVGATFIFCTHMHHLVEFIDSNTRISIQHLQLSYDATKRVLVYNRKLQPGPGSTMYGLEIAESLDMDREFMSYAQSIRKKIGNVNSKLLSTKQSRYNSRVYVDSCINCGSTTKLQTHHLKEQREASNGFVDHTPIHSKGNLVVVCEKCHSQFHMTNAKMRKLRTTKGIVLIE